MKQKIVLVTGIGGNQGQGILRNIISLNLSIKLIGTNVSFVSAGNHLCDSVYEVPFSSDESYISVISSICEKEKVDLIIPSTDYETYFLSVAGDKLPLLACSKAETTKTFLNKYLTAKEFKKYDIPFAETYLPSEYNNTFKEYIVKPAEGRGSRDVYRNPKNPKEFSDDFVIQKLYKGKEITTAFYVTKKNSLLGSITLERSLQSGATMECEVNFVYDKEINRIIKKIIKNFEIRGSCNVQAIVTDGGEIVPFELNCRISGTNSIRSHFGFEDVKYTIQEYLYNETPQKPTINSGSAVRILVDVIYPNTKLREIKNNKTKYIIF